MSLSASERKIVEHYAAHEPHQVWADSVKTLLQEGKDAELKAMFFPRIAFGTAGLRAFAGPGYKNINDLVVIQTTQGLAQYIKQQFPEEYSTRGVVLGFDGRYDSKRFAGLAAAVMIHAGIPVNYFPDITCTPLVPYAIGQLKACGGVMVTASHNPKDDNGYKLFYENMSQIVSPHDKNISALILQNQEPWSTDYKLDTTSTLYTDVTEDMETKYFAEVASRCVWNKDTNADSKVKVTYTAMHGVGAPFVKKAFAVSNLPPYVPVLQQVEVDPDFTTVKFPNPEEGAGALKLAIETAKASGSHLILANDPDADRLAVAELDAKTGEFYIFDGNQIAALFADWIWKHEIATNPDCDKSKQLMVASTASSKFLKAMAEAEGFSFVDTLTGFKWIGSTAERMVREQGFKFLFGYEVEIGFLSNNMSYDKDGVRMAAMFYEMASNVYKTGVSLKEHWENLCAKYGYFEMITSYYFCNDTKIIDSIFDQLRDYKGTGTYPAACGEFKIKSVRDVTLGFDNAMPGNKSVFPHTPNQNMLTFTFENGSVLTLRPSGTEPKLKYYVESNSKQSRQEAKAITQAVTEALVNDFIQPKKYGMKGKGE